MIDADGDVEGNGNSTAGGEVRRTKGVTGRRICVTQGALVSDLGVESGGQVTVYPLGDGLGDGWGLGSLLWGAMLRSKRQILDFHF